MIQHDCSHATQSVISYTQSHHMLHKSVVPPKQFVRKKKQCVRKLLDILLAINGLLWNSLTKTPIRPWTIHFQHQVRKALCSTRNFLTINTMTIWPWAVTFSPTQQGSVLSIAILKTSLTIWKEGNKSKCISFVQLWASWLSVDCRNENDTICSARKWTALKSRDEWLCWWRWDNLHPEAPWGHHQTSLCWLAAQNKEKQFVSFTVSVWESTSEILNSIPLSETQLCTLKKKWF